MVYKDKILKRELNYDDEIIGEGTLPELFLESVERFGTFTAQKYKGGVYDRSLTDSAYPEAPPGDYESITYEQMGEVVRRLGLGFRELGVSSGDRVTIFSSTRMEWAQVDYALLAIGAVIVTVYPESSPSQLEYLLNDSGSTGLVVENSTLLKKVREVEDSTELESIVLVDNPETPPEVDTNYHTLGDLYQQGRKLDDGSLNWMAELGEEDLASLVYTSGTVGRPKGVRLTHRNFRSNINQARRRYGPRSSRSEETPRIERGMVTISYLPLAHVFERLVNHFLMFASGATVAYAQSPMTLADDIKKIKPVVLVGVPRIYEKVYETVSTKAEESFVQEKIFEWAKSVGLEYAQSDAPGIGLQLKYWLADRLVFRKIKEAFGGRVDFCVSGGGSLSEELSRVFRGMDLMILEGYGLTETSPMAVANPPEQPRIGTLGLPFLNIKTKLDVSQVPETEKQKRSGKVGELLLKGPNVTDGYWQNPEKTENSFTEEGWFRTGDIVERRSDGYLVFVDRLKRLIVLSDGKNVASVPIERAFSMF